MIKNSFIFLERVGAGKEKTIWKQAKDWHDFLQTERIKGIAADTKQYYNRNIREAQQALLAGQEYYFRGKLPAIEMWRLYHYLRDESCFLDIEIDSKGRVIVIGVSNYYHTNQFVRGINLHEQLLQAELKKYKLLITFNGSSFDMPKLKKQLHVDMNMLHIDLKPLCVQQGWKGGLKEVERLLHLQRPAHLYGNPVEAWKAFHASGDREYLELLLEYNREDIENLKMIMEKVYQKKAEGIRQWISCNAL